MDFDDFGKDSDFDGADEFMPEERGSVESVDTEALEKWLLDNHGLWQLGLHLASVARQYRRDYRHVPFNNTGWFSPN